MNPVEQAHIWSAEAHFSKALLYTSRCELLSGEPWERYLWSGMLLEHLCRAVLATVSPVLLADPKAWQHIYYAQVGESVTKEYTPRSISIKEVLDRLQAIFPTFTKEIASICLTHFEGRNAELHSGTASPHVSSEEDWRPKFYYACECLLLLQKRELADLFPGDPVPKELIDSLNDAVKSEVLGLVGTHRSNWEAMSEEDRNRAKEEAERWSTRNRGHRVDCPACSSAALITGTASGPVQTTYDSEGLKERQAVYPSRFYCQACHLQIIGLSKLMVVNLGAAYQLTVTIPPEEYYDLFTREEYEELGSYVETPDFDFNE